MTAPRPSASHYIATRAAAVAGLCALGALSATLSRWWPADSWPRVQWLLELAAHWQWLYAVVGALAATAALAAARSWGPRVVALDAVLVLAICFAWRADALPRAPQSVAATTPVLVVGTANLHLGTTDFTALLQWLASDDSPDVVMLQEFTDDAERALTRDAAVAQRYPHRLAVPQPDPFGLALLSRHPLTDANAVQPQDPNDTLRLRATLAWQGRAVHLSAVHPFPPLSAAHARVRDAALAEEARHLAERAQPDGLALMAGDMNTTPWARGMWALDDFLRSATGAVPSWPNAGGVLSLLPLDHVLASTGWQTLGAQHGPHLGSDHRPVVVRLVVRQP